MGSVGVVSTDGHIFTKTEGNRKMRMGTKGRPVELSQICMVFDRTLRCGGTHRYNYQVLDGELGAADGAGFVFDSKVRRNHIQRMRSIFLNKRGQLCLRDQEHVQKLEARLPPLDVGMCLTLHIDLDELHARFVVFSPDGSIHGTADLSLNGLFTHSQGG